MIIRQNFQYKNIDANNLGTEAKTFNTITNIDTNNNFELGDKAFYTINIDTNKLESVDSTSKTIIKTIIESNNLGIVEDTIAID